MGTAERRIEILKILSKRRSEKTKKLAEELGVSERTIRRDILVLSLTEPIYTQAGRYGGGVYMMEGYAIDYVKLSESELELLHNLHDKAQTDTTSGFSNEEVSQLKQFIKKHSNETGKTERKTNEK